MTKGKYGLSLAAIAVLAFALMCIGSTEILLLLLVGYAVIIEKNDWLIRQTLQAFYLRLSYLVATSVLSWLYGFPFSFLSRMSGFSVARSSLNTLLWLLMLGLGIYAVTRVVKDEDAEIPLINNLVHLTMGTFKRRPQPEYRQPPAQSAYTPAAPYTAAPASYSPEYAAAQSVEAVQTEDSEVDYRTSDERASSPETDAIIAPAPVAAYTPAPATPAAAYTPAPAAYRPAPAAPAAAYTPAPAAYRPAPAAPAAAYTPAPAAYTPAPSYTASTYTAPAPAAAPNAWTCSCGASNVGNFCIHCGSPKK